MTQLDQARSDERSVGEILNDVWEKSEALVRKEMRLGLTEAQEKVDVLKHELDDRLQVLKLEVAAKALGGTLAIGGAFALVAAMVLLLAEVMLPWLAALIIGAVLSGVGYALLQRPIKLPDAPNPSELVPQRTISNIKADVHALEEASHGTTK